MIILVKLNICKIWSLHITYTQKVTKQVTTCSNTNTQTIDAHIHVHKIDIKMESNVRTTLFMQYISSFYETGFLYLKKFYQTCSELREMLNTDG